MFSGDTRKESPENRQNLMEELKEQIRAFHHVKKERWSVFLGGLVIGAIAGAAIATTIQAHIILNLLS